MAAVSAKPSDVTTPSIVTSEEGFKLACINRPSLWSGTSRMALIFNAGSRYEVSTHDRGICHLLRRACGLSTTEHTSVNLTRHIQQMGARIACSSTREHMIYTIDSASNVTERAAQLLVEMATDCTFYEWELKTVANKLMLKDIDLLNRRNLPALTFELLHEAAFGTNPSGCGLGNSLFASADHVGSYTLEQIERFHQCHYTPMNTVLALVGPGDNGDGMAILKQSKQALHVRPQHTPTAESTTRPHGFVGGEIRRNLAAADDLHVMFAWPTSGLGSPDQLPLDLAARLLTGAVGRISSGGGCSTQKYLATSDADLHSETTWATAFHKTYSGGHGLFGVCIHGSSSQAVAQRIATLIPRLVNGVTVLAEDVEAAKPQETLEHMENLMLHCLVPQTWVWSFDLEYTDDIVLLGDNSWAMQDVIEVSRRTLQAEILADAENPTFLATDLAIQLSRSNQCVYESPEQRAAAVAKVTEALVNKTLKKTVTSCQAAMSVVGAGTGEVPPLRVLLSV